MGGDAGQHSAFDDMVTITALVLVITHVIDEMDQAFTRGLAKWMKSTWNRADAFLYSIIVTGYTLRISDDGGLLSASKIIIGIGAMLLWLRTLRFMAKSQMFGPKMFMIYAMGKDVIVFVGLLTIILAGYAVAMYSVVQPWRGIDSSTAESLIYQPMFNVFGELFLDEVWEDAQCVSNDTGSCPKHYWIACVLLIVYMLLSNIILVNLLIAMMSATYEKVDDNALEVWSL